VTVNLVNETRKRVVVAKSAGHVIRRVTPLGLTSQEAIAWYRNNMDDDSFMKSAISIVLGVGLVLFVWVAGGFLQSSLTVHMLQYSVFVAVGVLFAYAAHSIAISGLSVRVSMIYDSMLSKLSIVNRYGIVSFISAALLTCYWGLPSRLDASLNDVNALAMHLCFILVGILVLAGSLFVPRCVLTILPIIVGKMLGLYGAFLILSPKNLYDIYPAIQQTETGVVMVTLMVLIDMTILPYWLYRYFGDASRIRQS
jgi:hypothetical protein